MIDARDLPDNQRMQAEVCIVGGGAAGIALAIELVATGIDVLLIESGGVGSNREADALNVGTVVDERLHPPLEQNRRRQFGGSISKRESRCTAFTAIELEMRRYVPESGWPLTGDMLAPYYARAMRLCESDESAQTQERDALMAQSPLVPGFRPEHFDSASIDHYGPLVDFGKRYGRQIAGATNVCVLSHATVTRIQLNRGGTAVEGLVVRTEGGRTIQIKSRQFVLAAGTLENARLLLASRDVHRNGIGNDNDNVGRYLMCPLQGAIGTVQLTEPPNAIWYGHARDAGGIRSRRRMTLSDDTQRRLQIGQFAVRLRHPTVDSVTGNKLGLSHLLPRLMPGRQTRFRIDWQAEQQPNPSSRVMLGSTVDATGVPTLRADWNCNVADFKTVRRGVNLFREALRRSGAGSFDHDPAALSAMITCHGDQGNHHVGTTRMGTDRRSSVVDADCRVHGVDNLYVAGASVFPTSGLGDPMLTVTALSIRLGERLKRQEQRVVTLTPRTAENWTSNVQPLFGHNSQVARR